MNAAEEICIQPPLKKFTNRTDELAFTQRQSRYRVYAINVYHLRPPKSVSSTDRPWITTATDNFIFRHPLTSKPHSFNLPPHIYISRLNPSTLSVYYGFVQPYSVDKLLVLPSPIPSHQVERCTLFALYGGGLLQGCPRVISRRSTPVAIGSRDSLWVKISYYGGIINFDDIIDFQDKVYAVDRQGITYLVNHYKTVAKVSMGKTLIYKPLTPGSGQFGWRKRFAAHKGVLYVVVRTEEKLFQVFRLMSWVKGRAKTCFYWGRVKRFKGNKALFMARDFYFFLRATNRFPGWEYRNCIVFSEAAFPRYGKDCWEFTESGKRFGVVRRSEDDDAVFRVSDRVFAREGENSAFPKINWSPPAWIFNASSVPADEFQGNSASVSSSQSER